MMFENTSQYAQVLKDWIPKEASVAIVIEGICAYYVSGIHDIGMEVGKEMQQGDIAEEVMIKKMKVERYIEDSNYRVSYYGIGYPISIEGKEAVIVVILPPFHQSDSMEPLTFLTGKEEDCWCPVLVEDIVYIESLQKKIWFYKNTNAYQSIYTLKELTDLLPKQFLRIHRSYIVNIKKIVEISRDFTSNIVITLTNGTTLPVSQTYSVPVRRTLGF